MYRRCIQVFRIIGAMVGCRHAISLNGSWFSKCYHKQNQVELTVSPPQWLGVNLSLKPSSGPSFVLVQRCLLMKSLDTQTLVTAKFATSFLISRKREISSPQSVECQPFTNHFKKRTSRYDLLLNFLLMLTCDIKYLFNTLSTAPDLYLDELRLELQERLGVLVSMSTIWRTLRKGGYTMKKVRYVINQSSGRCSTNSIE